MRILAINFVCMALLACSPANGQDAAQPRGQDPAWVANWAVDKNKSTLSFTGVQTGETFTGQFTNFDARIKFDPDHLSTAKVMVSIDMASADGGDGERTEALPGKDWFFVKKFPTAQFFAADFTHSGGDQYLAKGRLTLRAVQKNVHLPFSIKIENGHALMDGTLELNRQDFGVGGSMWKNEDWVAHKVKVNVHIEADKN